MKRLVIALVLLSLTIGFATGGYFLICKKIDEVIVLMENDRELTIETGHSDKERTKKVIDTWKDSETFLVSILAHQELEEIEIGIKCLSDYQKQSFTEEYIKTLNECINHLYHIKETEKADTKNIF